MEGIVAELSRSRVQKKNLNSPIVTFAELAFVLFSFR
jgi:hypothetical protein